MSDYRGKVIISHLILQFMALILSFAKNLQINSSYFAYNIRKIIYRSSGINGSITDIKDLLMKMSPSDVFPKNSISF